MKTINKGNSFKISNNNNHKNQRSIPYIILLKDLLSNTMSKIGIIGLLFGLPFAFVFVSYSGLFSTSFNNDDPVAVGIITGSIATDAYAGDVEIYEYEYQYKLPDGNIYTDKGYGTGNIKKRGEGIRIIYKQKNPAKSKAIDLRTSLFGGAGAVIGLFSPVFGLIALF